jgi:hypothetical protein
VDKSKVGGLGLMRWHCGSICTTKTYLVDPQLSGLPVLFLYSWNLCQTDFAILLSIADADRFLVLVVPQ